MYTAIVPLLFYGYKLPILYLLATSCPAMLVCGCSLVMNTEQVLYDYYVAAIE